MCLQFTPEELKEAERELNLEARRLMSGKFSPDVLLGNHPVVRLASKVQRIRIWHGRRIETHFGSWVNRIPGWTCQNTVRFAVSGELREVDHVLFNRTLGVVLTVETKRDYTNQDSGAKRDAVRTHQLYTKNRQRILDGVEMPKAEYRHLLFDAYGNSKGGNKALPVISGAKIGRIFGRCLWSHMEWELNVIRTSFAEVFPELGIEPKPSSKAGEDSIAVDEDGCRCNAEDVLSFIDKHAKSA